MASEALISGRNQTVSGKYGSLMFQWKSFNMPPKEGEHILALTLDRSQIHILNYHGASPYTDCIGWMAARELLEAEQGYDPLFGDEKMCLCGHEYHRHFDPFEDYAPVGCKYCYGLGDSCCNGFVLDPNPNNTGCPHCDRIEGRKECLCPPRTPIPDGSVFKP